MRKFLSVFLVLLLCIACFTGCGEKEQTEKVTFTSIDDLKAPGVRFGVLTGTVADQITKDNFPDCVYEYYENIADMSFQIEQDQLDAFLVDEPVARYAAIENPAVTYLPTLLAEDHYAFGFPKTDDGLRLSEDISAYLRSLKEDGTLKEIDALWFGADEAHKKLDYASLTGENGTLRAATCSLYPPFSYVKDNQIVGYPFDVLYRYCKEKGLALEITDMNFTAMLPAISSGKYDVAVTSLSVTEERKEEIYFSEPFYDGGIVAVVRNGGSSKAAGDRSSDDAFIGKKIGVLSGSIHEDLIAKHFPQAAVDYYNNYGDLTVALTEGVIDAFSCEGILAKSIVKETPGLQTLDVPLATLDCGFAFAKNAEGKELCGEFNDFLASAKTDGTIGELEANWFGDSPKEPALTYPSASGGRTLRLATSGSGFPYSYIKNGQLVGYDIELACRFCQSRGYGLEVSSMNFSAVMPGLASGQYDLAANCIVITDERKENAELSDPYLVLSALVIVRAEDAASDSGSSLTFEDFAGNPIGFHDNSGYEPFVAEALPDSPIMYFRSTTDMINATQTGQILGFALSVPVAETACAENDKITYLPKPIVEIPYGFIFNKNEKGQKLCSQMDEFLAELTADGTLAEMQSYWSGPEATSHSVDYNDLLNVEPTLEIAMSGDDAPFNFSKDNGFAGLEVDILTRFCRKYGYGLHFSAMDFGALVSGIASDRYDVACNTIIMTEERKESVLFSSSYGTCQLVMIVKKDEAPVRESFFDSLKSSFEKTFIREERWRLILSGIGVTVLISLLSAVFGTILGFGVCMLRRMKNRFLSGFAAVYIRLLQGTPIVVFLMILFYIVFAKVGFSAVSVAVIGFSMNFGAYVGEIMRSGIDGVEKGQTEAALALGYTPPQAFFSIVLPQAAASFLPVYRGEFVSLIKSTSIVGYIAIQDLTKVSDLIRSRTYEAFFPLIATALIYFILSALLGYLLGFLEKKLRPERKHRSVKGVVIK